MTCAATTLKIPRAQVLQGAGVTLLGAPSLKAALDIDWGDPAAQADALARLLAEVDRVEAWVAAHVPVAEAPAVQAALTALRRVLTQDLEPDPTTGQRRIRRGVAADRMPSLGDPEMRHGRKTRTKLFTGYKRHVIKLVDADLIVGAVVRPANEPEHHALALLEPDVVQHGPLAEVQIDRGYLGSPRDRRRSHAQGVAIRAKAWTSTNRGRFPKQAFTIDLAAARVVCPAAAARADSGRRDHGPLPRRRVPAVRAARGVHDRDPRRPLDRDPSAGSACCKPCAPHQQRPDGPRAPPRTHHRRALARPRRSDPRPQGALQRRAQEHARPPPRRRHCQSPAHGPAPEGRVTLRVRLSRHPVALTATLYNFETELADIDRGVYQSLALRLARQPSETTEFMLTRMLAYCLEYTEGIEFTEGVAAGDEPAVLVRDMTGRITDWIEVGMPDAARLHRGSKLAGRAAVYTHRNVAKVLDGLNGKQVHRAAEITDLRVREGLRRRSRGGAAAARQGLCICHRAPAVSRCQRADVQHDHR